MFQCSPCVLCEEGAVQIFADDDDDDHGDELWCGSGAFFRILLDTASLCSIAPSLHELDAELAQYGDLLDAKEDPADDVLAASDFGETVVTPLDMDSVTRLNELLPSESEELDRLELRPTAASLGLKDAIEKCLGDDLVQSGCRLVFDFMWTSQFVS